MSESQYKGKKENNAGEAEGSIDNRHNYFGQPFVGGPWQWWGQEGENISCRDSPMIEDEFAGPNMVTGIPVPQQPVSEIKHESKEKYDKNEVSYGGKQDANARSLVGYNHVALLPHQIAKKMIDGMGVILAPMSR
jgi:hypothetical protein